MFIDLHGVHFIMPVPTPVAVILRVHYEPLIWKQLFLLHRRYFDFCYRRNLNHDSKVALCSTEFAYYYLHETYLAAFAGPCQSSALHAQMY